MKIYGLKSYLFFVFISAIIISCNQKDDLLNQKKAGFTTNNILSEADTLAFNTLYDSSNQVLQSNLDLFLQDSNYTDYVKSLNLIADNFYSLGIQDSVIKYSEIAIDFCKKNTGPLDLEMAKSYYNLGIVQLDRRKFNKALELCDSSLKIRKQLLPDNSPLIGDNYNLLGNIEFYQSHPGKALDYYKKALILRKNRGMNNKSVASTYMNLGNIYNDLYEFEKAISYFDTARTIQKNISGENTILLAMIALNKASSYDKIGELDSAIISSKNALKILTKIVGEKHPYVGLVSNNLAILYGSFGDYSKAIEYTNNAIKILKNLDSEYKTTLIECYTALGEIHKEIGEYKNSIKDFEFALNLLKNSEKMEWERSSEIKKLLAIAYMNSGDIKKAISVAKAGIKELQNSEEFDEFKEIKSRIYLSEILTKQGNFEESITNSIECINYLTNTRHLDWLIYCYNYLAEAYYLNSEFYSVIDVYRTVRKIFTSEENSDDFDIKKINGYRGVNGLISSILNYTGEANFKLYRQLNNDEYLENCMPIYDLLIELFATNYSKVAFEVSKVEESKKFKDYFQSGIEAGYEMYRLHPTEANFEYVLKLSEFNKSLTVLEQLNFKAAFSSLKLPPDKLKEMKNEQRKINSYLRKLASDNSGNLSDNDIEFYNSQILKSNLIYENIKTELEADYPGLKSLLEINLEVSLNKIRNNLLDSNQTAIEYYLTDNEFYAYIISQSSFDIVKSELSNNIAEDVKQLNKAIKENEKDEFISISQDVYNMIFREIDSRIETPRILLITDGILGFIPFDALLFENPMPKSTFKDLPYLINKYSIGYAYSFNILSKSKQADNKISSYLGIAPFSGKVQ